MQDEQINNLVERFLDGETTLAEEKQLYDYFSQNENVDESLLPYAEYFRDLAVLPSPQKEEKPRKRPRWTIRWTQWAVGAAAAVLISLGGMWIYTLQEERHLAQLYGGSYMIVDGKRYDNLREIKDDIRPLSLRRLDFDRRRVRDNFLRARYGITGLFQSVQLCRVEGERLSAEFL